jgi:gliding motility-associated-like protein
MIMGLTIILKVLSCEQHYGSIDGLYVLIMILGKLLKRLLIIPMLMVYFNADAQIAANFTASTSTSCSPATISFDNISAGPYKTSFWQLDNGTTSNFTDASAIYVTPGKYTITLTVSDGLGNTDTKSEQIEIFKNPKANFTSSVTIICERDEVSFTDNTVRGDTALASWVWDLGDGTVVYSENPKYAYPYDGLYTLRLAVTDHNGCTGDTAITNYIRVKEKPEPQFSFSPTRVCKPPVAVSFNNTTATSGNSFLWKYTDGTTATATRPTKSFTTLGTHDVKLVATNVSGCTDSITIKDSILIAPLTVDFIWSTDALCAGSEVVFTQNCTPDLTTPTNYRWTFPGGISKTGKSVRHKLEGGSQAVTLNVVNAQCQKSTTKTVQINPSPQKSMEFSDTLLCGRNQFLSFTFDDDGIDSFRWNINGDQKTSVFNGVILDTEGEHYISLYLKDNNGCAITLNDTLYQSIPTLIMSEDTGGCIPYAVASSLTAFDQYKIDSVIWDLQSFGQGRYSGYTTPSLTLSDTGVFIVDVSVYDSIGCVFPLSRVIEGGYVPVASYTVDTTMICNRQSPVFTSTSNSPYVPTEYHWSAANKTGITPIWNHNFDEFPGTYPISHRVAHYGCWDEADQRDTLHILGPYVAFGLSSDGCFDAYKTVTTIVKEADSFSYFLNNMYLNSDTVFQKNFTNNDTLKIYSSNSITGCLDSMTRVINLNGDATIDWNVSASTCAPALIEVKRIIEGVDSFKWKYDGRFVAHQEEVFRTTASSGGDISISLVGYLGDSCVLQLDTVIRVAGPRVKALVGRSVGCYPIDLRLIDSFWNDPSERRVWIVDGDTISSDTLVTNYQVKGIKNTQDNLLVVKMLAGENGCTSSKQFNYAYPTIKFETSYTSSVSSCNTADYTFKINVDESQINDVKGYQIEYNGTIIKGGGSVFSQSLVLDGSLDTIYLSVESLSGCLATKKVFIQKGLPTLNARFTTGNTQAACPPLMVNFKDESVSKLGNITATEWYIDGEPFSVFANPSRVFSEPGAYDVELVVRDDQGCVDSLHIDSFVTLLGEQVDVDFGPSMVCKGQKNEFKVVSGSASSYEWDMGDGTVLKGDSVAYTYSDTGSYQLRLLVSDASCKYPLVNDLLTKVVPNPKADFTWTKSCPLQATQFINLSTTSTPRVKLDWSVGNLSYVDLEIFSHTLGGGDEFARLVVTDSLGCKDSINKRIKVYPVSVDFSLDREYYCIGDSIRVSPSIVSDTAVKSVFTYFNDVLESQSTKPTISADIDGYFDIGIIASNEANCSDTLSRNKVLKVAGPLALSNAAITYISVGDNSEVIINWDEDTTGIFEKYELRDVSNALLWESNTSTEVSDSLVGLNPEQGAVCLTLQVENGCNTPANTNTHCTVHTTGEAVSMARKINWTPYRGWDNVDEYSIYRDSDAGYEFIGSVSGSELSYVDSVHVDCDKVQKYKVTASGEYISFSDTCHVRPIWDYSIVPPKFSNISVIDDEFIELKLNEYLGELPLENVVFNRKDYLGSVSIQDIGSVMYSIDKAVDVHSGVYSYTAHFQDVCSGKSPSSTPVSSIFLSTTSDASTTYPRLTWSQAKMWDTGVKYYIIFKKNASGEFSEIGRTYNQSDTTYLDNSSDIECSRTSCYVVQAYDNDNSRVSRSNSSCSGVKSRIYAPNAMTPNGDGLNDVYRPRGLYIARYHIEIYSRWGEKIFETDECMQPWDGKVKGESASEGVYFYIINATGADGVRHNLSGTITVLK